MSHAERPALRLVTGEGASETKATAHGGHPSQFRRYGPALYIGSDRGRQALVTHVVPGRGTVTLVAARSGRAGLRMALQRRPRLVVLEGQLPDLDAEEVVVALRRQATPPPTPIAVLAHEGSPHERARFLWAGASAYLSEPVTSSHVQRTIGLLMEVAAWR